jgi:two-component system, OmpR family, sensor histidine kinase KdpD
VPDPVVRAAGEVELVDVAPQALQERLVHGLIYSAERAGAALGSWFQTPNLSALRELALLWLAGKLASDRRRSRPGGQVLGDGHVRERVVVALSGGPEGETLIRRAARIAAWPAGDLLAVHAARPGGPAAAGRAALAAQRQLTVSLGGTYHQLADPDIPAALLAFAQAENATQLVLGATRRTPAGRAAAHHHDQVAADPPRRRIRRARRSLPTPLPTGSRDTHPDQANGNGLNINGGP